MNYRLMKRKNPQTKAYAYYAVAVASGESTLNEIASAIERSSTCTRADVMAVLIAYNDEVCERLKQGQIVRLGDLGALQFGLHSAAAATEDDFQPTLIKKASVCFHAGKSLKTATIGASFKRVYNKQDIAAAQTPATGGSTSETPKTASTSANEVSTSANAASTSDSEN